METSLLYLVCLRTSRTVCVCELFPDEIWLGRADALPRGSVFQQTCTAESDMNHLTREWECSDLFDWSSMFTRVYLMWIIRGCRLPVWSIQTPKSILSPQSHRNWWKSMEQEFLGHHMVLSDSAPGQIRNSRMNSASSWPWPWVEDWQLSLGAGGLQGFILQAWELWEVIT